MKIVVLGAGGFVGGWICEELSQRDDVDLVACVRKWASAVRLARRGLNIRQADLDDADALRAIVSGADAVINAAMPEPSREADTVASAFRTCASAQVGRFVQFSSAAVYGSRTGNADETMAPSPADDYSRGKAAMEDLLLETSRGSNMPVFILRPSIIYGPFSGAWTVRYVERIVQGRWQSLGRMGEGTCNLIYAGDTAMAAIAAATVAVEAGQYTLNLNGPDVVTWNDYIDRLGNALGINDRNVPSALLFRTKAAAAEVMRMGARLPYVKSFYRRSVGTARMAMKSAQDVTKLYPSLSELELLSRKVHYTAEKAADILGFTASTSLEAGLRQSVAWCRLHGVV